MRGAIRGGKRGNETDLGGKRTKVVRYGFNLGSWGNRRYELTKKKQKKEE